MTESPVADWHADESKVSGRAFRPARVQKPRVVQSGLTPAKDSGPAVIAQQAQDAIKAAEDRAVETANAKNAAARKRAVDSLQAELGADCEIREIEANGRVEIYARKAPQ